MILIFKTSAIFSKFAISSIKLLSHLPKNGLYILSDILYLLGYQLFGYRKKVVRQNLKNAFPHKSIEEIKIIESQFYRNLCDIIVETIKCTQIDAKTLEEFISFEHSDEVNKLLDSKKSFIFTAGHAGNWELANLACSYYLPLEVRAIYQPLNNHSFETFYLNWRAKFGTKLFPKKKNIANFVFADKSMPFSVALINDQSPNPKIAFWTYFFNQETGFYRGAADLAIEHNFPLVFMHVHRISRGKYVIKSKLIRGNSADELLGKYVRLLENEILKDPANWLWSHKRWKHKKPVF